MKRILSILTIAVAIALFAVQPVGAQTDDGLLKANKALVRNFYSQVLNGADVSAADKLLSPDYQHNEDIPAGREAYKQFLAAFRTAIPNYTATIQDMIAEGDWVAVHATASGTQKGVLNGIPATGKNFTVQTADLFRIKDGQLVEHVGIFENLSLYQQLGVLPAPAVATAQPTASAAATASAANVSQATLDNNKTLVQKLETALYSGDTATIDQLVAVDYVYHRLGGAQGREGVKKVFAGFRATFADFHIDVLKIVAERDIVAIYTTFSGTQQAPILGVPSTGKKFSTHTIDFYRIQNGQAVEHWDAVDYFGTYQQLGIIPSSK